ncbi:MAG: putative heme iron utilization protein [Thermoproteota archaeon]|jgi:putative heme iron utilization protein
MNENSISALKLLKNEATGILSTHSLDVEGYPFGSVTPYSLDDQFNPIILVSAIAQHTKNMDADAKVSLTITEGSTEAEKQSLGRYTFLGDAKKIESGSDDYKNVSERYLRYYPVAKQYFEAHNFDFYRINFVKGRYIRGFGKIFWIENTEWTGQSVFSKEDELYIINHMNNDHGDTLRKYMEYYKAYKLTEEDKVEMIGIYQYGMDLKVGKEKYHIEFTSEVTDTKNARELLVSMAKVSANNLVL